MTKFLFLTCLFLFACLTNSIAQRGKISGKLKDQSGKRVDYATVTLLSVKDSAIVKGSLSNDSGCYSFERVLIGTYRIRATSVGYQPAYSKTFSVSPDSSVLTVPDILLSLSAQSLETVTIKGSKPLIEQSSDKTIINVAGSILSSGNSALEILARAPGVSIDKDDNISLKGKGGVSVMINNKLTYLSPSQLATLLSGTDGSSIQSIEIISNPSAKYDAAGNAGIINIKLKKSKQSGTNGNITVGAGLSKYGKDNQTFSLNHNNGNLNIFGSFNHNDNKREQLIDFKRIVMDPPAPATYFDQSSVMHRITHNNTYRLGADYELSPANTLGFVINGYFNSSSHDANGFTGIGRSFNKADSSLRTVSGADQNLNNFAVNLNDTWKIDSAGQQLNIDLDYSRFRTNETAQYMTDFYSGDGRLQHPQTYLGTQSPSIIDIQTAKLDYVKPLTKALNFESGVKLSNVKSDNDLRQKQIPGNEYSSLNHFVYNEKIDAAYVNFNRNFLNTTVKIGLRTEYTSSKAVGDSSNIMQTITRHYFDFFPSVFVTHSFFENNEIGINYSRRIDRPGYSKLNPFIFVLDPYSYIIGNPYLKPQYTNNFELNYTRNKGLSITLGYSRTTDVIGEVPGTNTKTKISFITNENLNIQNNYSVTLFIPYTFTTWWEGNINTSGYYLGYKSSNLQGSNLDRGRFAFQIKSAQIFTLAESYKAELLTNYISAYDDVLYNSKSAYGTDVGISHNFDHKRASIKLSLSDIFNTWRDDATSNYQANIIDVHQKRESRITRITFIYNFGTDLIKARQHKTGADDESRRAKGGN